MPVIKNLLVYILLYRGACFTARCGVPSGIRLLPIGITIINPPANLCRIPSHNREPRDILYK